MIRIVAADDVGLLKVVEGPDVNLSSLKQVATWCQPDRERGIECIAITTPAEPSGTAFAAVGRNGGGCEVLDAATGQTRGVISESSRKRDSEGNSIRGLHFLAHHPQASSSRPVLLSCRQSGQVAVHESSSEGEWREIASWQGPKAVLSTAVDTDGQRIAFGCEGSHLGVWSIAEGRCEFSARGPKPDRVGLVDKAANTAVAFLPGAEQRIVVGTARHKLMLYAPAEGRRPRFVIPFREGKITALAPEANGAKCWAADSRGEIACLDIAARKVMAVLKGPAGAIRSLTVHPRLPLIASGGLDRFLRLHDLNTRKCVSRIYLKQQLTAVAFDTTGGSNAQPAGGTAEGEDSRKRGPEDDSAPPEAESEGHGGEPAAPAVKPGRKKAKGSKVEGGKGKSSRERIS